MSPHPQEGIRGDRRLIRGGALNAPAWREVVVIDPKRIPPADAARRVDVTRHLGVYDGAVAVASAGHCRGACLRGAAGTHLRGRW